MDYYLEVIDVTRCVCVCVRVRVYSPPPRDPPQPRPAPVLVSASPFTALRRLPCVCFGGAGQGPERGWGGGGDEGRGVRGVGGGRLPRAWNVVYSVVQQHHNTFHRVMAATHGLVDPWGGRVVGGRRRTGGGGRWCGVCTRMAVLGVPCVAVTKHGGPPHKQTHQIEQRGTAPPRGQDKAPRIMAARGQRAGPRGHPPPHATLQHAPGGGRPGRVSRPGGDATPDRHPHAAGQCHALRLAWVTGG